VRCRPLSAISYRKLDDGKRGTQLRLLYRLSRQKSLAARPAERSASLPGFQSQASKEYLWREYGYAVKTNKAVSPDPVFGFPPSQNYVVKGNK
jgi:hypothetical protein